MCDQDIRAALDVFASSDGRNFEGVLVVQVSTTALVHEDSLAFVFFVHKMMRL